ncbi:MAG: 23S rRNA (guanosine(2251)-2'-O)-methyltransferase RlmB [Candidatus Omnitrophica bacterium]|nr:23S rRNA (guanosine(2251)-2'-O)-methyltransferase RlmB [Candidatus Omnitrophota bacterium]
MYLYGKNSVLERLKSNPKSVKKIFLQENFKDERLLSAVRASKIACEWVTEKALLRIKRADRMQGIAALAEDFQYMPYPELLEKGLRDKLSLIFVDSLNDPHNLGSIIRIAACFSGFGVVIPKHRSCEVNDTVVHVSSGGENFVPVSMVTNISDALIKAKNKNYWIVGTVVEGGEDINKVSLPFPLCLVLGSEGEGIRHGVEKRLELKVSLPMRGAALSFNVAMAAAIFCHEIAKQKLT